MYMTDKIDAYQATASSDASLDMGAENKKTSPSLTCKEILGGDVSPLSRTRTTKHLDNYNSPPNLTKSNTNKPTRLDIDPIPRQGTDQKQGKQATANDIVLLDVDKKTDIKQKSKNSPAGKGETKEAARASSTPRQFVSHYDSGSQSTSAASAKARQRMFPEETAADRSNDSPSSTFRKLKFPMTPTGRQHEYNIHKNDTVFTLLQEAWLDGWSHFLMRLHNPKGAADHGNPARQVYEMVVEFCSDNTTVTSLQSWQTRSTPVTTKELNESIEQWGKVFCNNYTSRTPVDGKKIQRLISVIKILSTPEGNVGGGGVHRAVCITLLATVCCNTQSCVYLVNNDAYGACCDIVKVLHLKNESRTVESLLFFLVKTTTHKPEDYQAREVERCVFKTVNLLLQSEPTQSLLFDGKLSWGAEIVKQVMVVILKRIDPRTSTKHWKDNMCAFLESPGAFNSLVTWYYDRTLRSDTIGLTQSIIQTMVGGAKDLPKHMAIIIRKALRFDHPCSYSTCGLTNQPLGATDCCPCKAVFYCSENCQHADWAKHKQSCKGAWQDDIKKAQQHKQDSVPVAKLATHQDKLAAEKGQVATCTELHVAFDKVSFRQS